MKGLLLVALALSVSAGPTVNLEENAEVVPQAAIDYINSVQTSWVASKEWVGSMTVGKARSYATSVIGENPFPEYNWGALLDYMSTPESFDSRTQWPNCVPAIRNQEQCGSCWAFGAAESLGNRFCIASNGAESPVLSPQYLVDCDTSSYGCNGGYPYYAWYFMENPGLPLESCVPYKGADGSCPSSCSNGASMTFYKATNIHSYSGASSIHGAIMTKGPIEVSFTVYQDFMSYTSGVYIHTWGGVLGGHAVKMVGWGVSGSQKYWICANSWGGTWGIQGYFWIGYGQCGIDSSGVAGDAVLN